MVLSFRCDMNNENQHKYKSCISARQFFCKLIIIKKLLLPVGLYEREKYYKGM